METRYAIVTIAVLIPEWVKDEDDVREYLRLAFKLAGVECVTADDLPQDGERCH